LGFAGFGGAFTLSAFYKWSIKARMILLIEITFSVTLSCSIAISSSESFELNFVAVRFLSALSSILRVLAFRDSSSGTAMVAVVEAILEDIGLNR
jgi:hypothetical protein